MPAEAPDHVLPLSPAPSIQADVLLAELEDWRDLIARHLAQKYHAIAEPDLNYSILRTILQVLFVKIGEERGLVNHGTLRRLCDADHIHESLCSLVDDTGNVSSGGVFPEDETAHQLRTVDDDTIRSILERTGSFDFPSPVSAIPLEDLAAVFERYLGTTMGIAEGYRVKRDDKSAVKYAGGVHITPPPLVSYMVEETIGRLLEGKTPREVSEIRILDPACGAGIFLIAVYRYLLNWHLAWYRKHLVSVLATREHIPADGIHALASALPVPFTQEEPEEPDLPVMYCGTRGPKEPSSWALSPPEKQRILYSSIAGTDIDPDAVEVTRFLLLLSTLEEFTDSVIEPTGIPELCTTSGKLQAMIQCGNALIGPDYFSFKQEHPFNANERRRVNAFDWQGAYPGVLSGGGFDAVIGAPPAHRPFSKQSRDEYFQMRYAVYAKTAGLYGYFIERGLQLLKDGGVLAFTVPDTFLRSHHARPLRRFLLTHQIEEIADFGEYRLLQNAETRTCILMIAKRTPGHAFRVSYARWSGSVVADEYMITRRFMVDQRSLDDGGWTLEDRRVAYLLEKIRGAGTPLEEHVMGQVERGTLQIKNNPFIVDAAVRTRLVRRDWRCKKFFRPLLRPADIQRYRPKKPDRFVIIGKNLREIQRCRPVWKYLQSVMSTVPEPSKENLRQAVPAREQCIHELPSSPCLNLPVLIPKTPRIICAPVQEHPAFSFDPRGLNVISRLLVGIPSGDPMLAAILNSKLGQFFITRVCHRTDHGYHLTPEKLGKFPVYTPDFDTFVDTARHECVVALVSRMLQLQKRLRDAKAHDEKIVVQQEIEATDVKIEALVYELYGLTAEEIQVIEESIR